MTLNPIDGRRSAPVLALAALAVAVTGALVSAPAQASGFQLKENSAKALGRAFAGSTAGPADVSVVVNNPAAMTQLRGTDFKIGVTAIDFKTQFTGSGTDALGQPLTGGNGGNGGTVAPVPAIFYSAPWGERGRFGFAITVPYGFTTEFNDDWKGRYKAIKSSLKTMDATVSYAYEVSNNFSVGGSVILQRTSADLTSKVDYGSLLGAPQQKDGVAQVKGDATDVGWDLGVLWKLSPNDRLAINYRAKIKHTLKGHATFHDVPSNLGQIVALGNFQSSSATADFATPAVLHVSYWHQATANFGIGLDVARTDWTSFKTLTVNFDSAQADEVLPENWKATMLYALGADYRVNDNWILRAGVAYDETPTNNVDRDPRVPDGARRWLSFGATWQPSDRMELDIGYAHLWVDDGPIDNKPATGTGGPLGSTLMGNFESSANLLGASLTYRF